MRKFCKFYVVSLAACSVSYAVNRWFWEIPAFGDGVRSALDAFNYCLMIAGIGSVSCLIVDLCFFADERV